MIFESGYWKEALEQEVKAFSLFIGSRSRYTVSVGVEIEKFVFTSAFIIRKLWDSDKLSTDIEQRNIPMDTFQLLDKSLFQKILPQHENPYDYYDMKKGSSTNLGIIIICNYLIHSYIFMPEILKDWNKSFDCIYILFNSDYTEEVIFKMSLSNWINICRWIYTDDVVSISQTRDLKTMRMHTVTKKRNPKSPIS